MITTIIFSSLLFLALWPYFVFVGALDFKRNPNTIEKQLSDRPARRTIGRKNEDIVKILTAILFFHFLLYGAYYTVIEFRTLLGQVGMFSVLAVLGAATFYTVSKANRLGNAYLSVGQLAVVHFVCAFVAFTVLSLFLYDNEVSVENMKYIAGIVIGAMLMFSKGLGVR